MNPGPWAWRVWRALRGREKLTWKDWGWIAGPLCVFSLLFAPVCLIMAFFFPQGKYDVVKALFLGYWTIGIPAFFFVDWWVQTDEIVDSPRYKRAVELAQKFWLAIAAFLLLIYFGDYVKKDTKDIEKRLETVEDKVGINRTGHQPQK